MWEHLFPLEKEELFKLLIQKVEVRKDGIDIEFEADAITSLVNLSPEIVEAIVHSREPDSLSLQRLVTGIPDDWEEQGRKLGF